MGYSIEYFLGYSMLIYERFIEGVCIGYRVFNKIYIYIRYIGDIL